MERHCPASYGGTFRCKKYGRWNWDYNHCLGNKKMYPAFWPIDLRRVYKSLCEGNPVREMLIGELCKTNEAKKQAVGNEKEITNTWVEEQLKMPHLTKTAFFAMRLKNPKMAFPHQMIPTVPSPYRVNSPPFNSTNLPNYLRIIMFGCWGTESFKTFKSLAADVEPFKVQAKEKRQYLKSNNLFDNEFLVVQINETVMSMSDTYADFCFELTQHKKTPFPKAVPDDKHFYRSIALFRLTTDLLKKAVSAGINPSLNMDPRSIGFDPEDVKQFGYYALFVTNLPFYMQQIWTTESVDFYNLMTPEEQEQEDEAKKEHHEDDKATDDESDESGGEESEGDTNEDPMDEDQYKLDISKYSTIFKVHSKLTVKNTKRGDGVAKHPDDKFNALPWYGHERLMQDQSIQPHIDTLWNDLFTEITTTTLKKLMIKVNENKATTHVTKNLSKKEIFEKLSQNTGDLHGAATDAMTLTERLEAHEEELQLLKAEKNKHTTKCY